MACVEAFGPIGPGDDVRATVAPVVFSQRSTPQEHSGRSGKINQRQPQRLLKRGVISAQYLVSLKDQRVDPDEHSVTVSMLYGVKLCGFCCVIETAFGRRGRQ